MGYLDNKVAIVTGSGRGIGRAVAEMFAREGARVVIADKDQEPANEAAAAAKAAGAEAAVLAGDITQPDFPAKLVETAISSFGRLDILVNNAGYTWDGMVHKMDDQQFQAMLDIHLLAPFRLIRAAAPYMRDQAREEIARGETVQRKIVNVTSVAGLMGNVGQANYSAAKAGLVGLTKTVAKEWGAFNINCNAVAFGIVDTRLTRPKEQGETVDGKAVGIPDQIRSMMLKMVPQRRPGSVEEAASGIFYLASPFSDYVNGEVLKVDGGFYA
ncbi:SDR family oxidoreductase [Metallumcola ferriviriculae]|uniref:SDR family oxidoreductase n=1 Tax=Metallumcola ferriviriculae TaxID=3039180 RepID=A0AAU0UQX7_9FIRM|nr:SDR family oxidoreductase [Desulfitibacteraceae bacterium MK1]